jgi:hypothetical protein
LKTWSAASASGSGTGEGQAGDAKAYTSLKALGMTDSQIQYTTNLLANFLAMGERIRGMEVSGEMEAALRDVFGRSGSAFIAPFKLNLKAEFEGAEGSSAKQT